MTAVLRSWQALLASVSALSLPGMPTWLGIHTSVTRVPDALRFWIVLSVDHTDSSGSTDGDDSARMAAWESMRTMTSGSSSSLSYTRSRAFLMPKTSAVKMLDPAFSRQACSTPRAGQNTAQAVLSASSWWAPSVKMAVLEDWRSSRAWTRRRASCLFATA